MPNLMWSIIPEGKVMVNLDMQNGSRMTIIRKVTGSLAWSWVVWLWACSSMVALDDSVCSSNEDCLPCGLCQNGACILDPTKVACQGNNGCCPEKCNANNDNDCLPTCGNGVVELGEICDLDCPTSCQDQDACTQDLLIGDPEQCNASCDHQEIFDCVDSDGCCPDKCDRYTDSDCTPICGNGQKEGEETCDPPASCPQTCNDQDPCTQDIMMGIPSACNVVCENAEIVRCINNDGCCPDSCQWNADNDCCEPGFHPCAQGCCPWDIQEVDASKRVGLFTSLTLDSNDLPVIAYYDRMERDLLVARWNGQKWLLENVDSEGYVTPQFYDKKLQLCIVGTRILLRAHDPTRTYPSNPYRRFFPGHSRSVRPRSGLQGWCM